jgi:general stress protein 26
VTRDELLAFLRGHRLAVQSSVSPAGAPQAAVVGFAVTPAFEFIFDTLDRTRKVANLRRDSRVALVVGGLADGEEKTAQIEGTADEPSGADLERLLAVYFARFPDGRARRAWPGITCVRVRPDWIRFSDFTTTPPTVVEFEGSALGFPAGPR